MGKSLKRNDKILKDIPMKDIKKTLNDIGLTEIENINYLQAIKRVIGMIDKNLAN